MMHAKTVAASRLMESLGLREPAATDEIAHQILEAAVQEFLESGFQKTSMEDVARRAKVSRVTVYRRFSTKTALVQAVFLRECRHFVSEVDAAIAQKADFEERIVEGFATALRLARANKLLSHALVSDPEILLHYMTTGAKPGLDVLRVYLAFHIRTAHGGRYEAGADQAAESVMRLGLSFLLTRESCIDLNSERAMREYAVRYVLPLIVGQSIQNY